MSYLEVWRESLKNNIKIFAPLARKEPAIHKIYGLVGASILWSIREKSSEQLEALQIACPDQSQQELLLETLDGWKKRTELEALHELDREHRKKPALQDAIDGLLNYFLEDLLDKQILKKYEYEVNAPITGANINFGDQLVLGDLTISYIMPKRERICPKPAEEPLRFAGRDTEFEELFEALESGQNCAITALNATGGMGKTTMARVLASRLFTKKVFRSVLWADVTRNPDFTSLITNWAHYADSSFEIQSHDRNQIALQVKVLLDELIEEKCENCEPPRVLMVLDDVWQNGLETARLLINARPENTTVLITTRNEKLVNDLQVTYKKSLKRMDEEESSKLLGAYLPRAESKLLKRLGNALGGHPLAMELAARRVKNEEGRSDLATALVRCITDYEQGIPAGIRFANLKLEQGEEKDDNLTTSLYYSYTALSLDAQSRFRALGILAYDAPFSVDLLQAIWQEDNEELVLEYCDELRLLSLMENIPGQDDRYQQHPLLRSYALALLQDTDELDKRFYVYASYIISVMGNYIILPPEAWSQINHDVLHIEFVGDMLVNKYNGVTTPDALEEQEPSLLSYLIRMFALRIQPYIHHRPFLATYDDQPIPYGIKWLNIGIEVMDSLAGKASILNSMGGAWDALGYWENALDFYKQALGIVRAINEKALESAILSNIGISLLKSNELEEALESCLQVLSIHRELDMPLNEAANLGNLGNIWKSLGESHKALDFFNQALAIQQRIGYKAGEATTLDCIASTWLLLGENRKALDFYNRALVITEEVGNNVDLSTTLSNIGATWMYLGNIDKALAFLNQALEVAGKVGNKLTSIVTLNTIGSIWYRLGDNEQALLFFDQAKELSEEINDKVNNATSIRQIGKVWRRIGDIHKALDFFNQALELFQETGSKSGMSDSLNDIGTIMQQMGQIHEALDFFSQALGIAEEIDYAPGIADVLNNIGLAQNKLGDSEKALTLFTKALTVTDNKSIEATTLNNIGLAWDLLGNTEKALEFYTQALPLQRSCKYLAGEASTLVNIGNIKRISGEYEEAFDAFAQALEIQRKIGYRIGEATTLNHVGNIWKSTGDTSKALEIYHEALLIRQEIGDKVGQGITLNNIADIWRILGNREQSLGFYNQILSIQREVDDKQNQARTLRNIGDVYRELGDVLKSLEYYNQSLLILQEIGDKREEAITLNNIGGAWRAYEQHHEALKFYTEALLVNNEVNDNDTKASILNNIGLIHSTLGNSDIAMEYYIQALNIQQELDDKSGEADTLNNIGQQWRKLGKFHKALKIYSESLELFQETGDKARIALVLNNIGFTWATLGNNQQALKFYNQSLSMRQEINDTSGKAATCINIALVHYENGDMEKAVDFYETGVSLMREVRHPKLNNAIEGLKKLRQMQRSVMKTTPSILQVRSEKIGRNDPCPCGSGKKYKKCCMIKDRQN